MKLVDHLIFREYRECARGLPVFRVLFALYVLLAVIPRYQWVAAFPDAFFSPPLGPALLFSGFPPSWVLYAIDAGIAVAAVSLLVGRRPRLCCAAIGSLLLLGNLWAYSFGKINHDILLIAVALIMAFSDRIGADLASAADGEDNNPPPDSPGWPVALLAFVLALGMLAAAVPKLATGWLDPDLSATYRHVVLNHFVMERPGAISGFLVDFYHPGFWNVLDYATVGLELGFVFALVHRRLFQLLCALAIFFHLGIYLSMDLVFGSTLPAYAVFVGWGLFLRVEIVKKGAERLDQCFAGVSPVAILATAAAISLFYGFIGNPWGRWVVVAALIFGAGIALVYIAKLVRRLYGAVSSRGDEY